MATLQEVAITVARIDERQLSMNAALARIEADHASRLGKLETRVKVLATALSALVLGQLTGKTDVVISILTKVFA